MARRSLEQMYELTGMTEAQRDVLIAQMYRRKISYARIAKHVGVSVGSVRASLRRTAERMRGGQPRRRRAQ